MARLSAEGVLRCPIEEIEKENDQILFLFAALAIAPKRKVHSAFIQSRHEPQNCNLLSVSI
jgi:hypothetical protein